jgi:uncharacterized protein with PQ loop repeat
VNWAEILGLVASIILPFWNIPLIIRIERRRSAADMSLWWTLGVYACFFLMLPAGLQSDDVVFKVFSVMNITIFSGVVVQVLRYHRMSPADAINR